ncbi:hypothetical protein L7F22_025842 [Adiantum nelumboides]|nr:hypothetical protein [Adiantum nelumboides]
MARFLTMYIAVVCLLCANCPPRINAAPSTVDGLVACFRSNKILNYTTSNSSSFNAVLDFSLQNLRFTEPGVSKPGAIILPTTVEEVQRAWACVLAAGWALRVRCGGHSYEGLSSTAPSIPFAIIDLMNMHAITVDVASKFVWVESGARIGELYYAIASASSNTLGFSAGTCATIGISGHVMGGGYGMLSRKYGVAADNVLDAEVITPNGTLIKKVSTSDPELFWALRGGGGGAWGIVVAWKLKLVSMPSAITTFSVGRTGKQALTDLVFKWQTVAPAAPPELLLNIFIAGTSSAGVADIGASFNGQYLGTTNQTVALVNSIFPELALVASDCKEGNWIQAVATMAGLSEPEELLSRQQSSRGYFKAKSDYVSKALTKEALSGAYDMLMNNTKGWMIFDPYGGIMSQISSHAIAFPYRAGNLFVIQYQVVWSNDTSSSDDELIDWLRALYSYMAPFVANTTSRSAYVNYIDLDLGDSVTAGKSYFGSNFAKLVKIKARFDPSNIFSQPQSVPVSM